MNTIEPGSTLKSCEHMTRRIKLVELIFISVSCIIGSGWLFSAMYCSQIAGPAALVSWVIGAVAVLFVALTIAEVGTSFPQSGGLTRYMNYTHGSLCGFLSAWINWLGIVAVIPTEAVASVQYLSSIPSFNTLYDRTSGHMSFYGLIAASVFILIYFFINYYTLKLFLRSLSAITIFKLTVPLLAVASIIWVGFEPSNFGHDFHTFAPHGINAIFIAITGGGIIYAFNGFQAVVNFAGEAKNPQRNIPIALIGSILLCLLIYLVLQAGFIGALSSKDLAHGWQGLNLSSPFIQLALSFNLNMLVLLLYVDAVVSPSGTGIVYVGSTARMLYGMQKSGYMPKKFGELDAVQGLPRNAMYVSLALSFLFLWIFKGWGNLAKILSITNSFSYIAGPMGAIGLRQIAKTWNAPCRVRGMSIIAPIAFTIISLIVYWSRWPLTGQVLLVVFGGLSIYFYYQHKNGWQDILQHLKGGLWLIVYMLTMALISWLGSTDFGGINFLKEPYDQIIVVVTALLFYCWGKASAWNTPQFQAYKEQNTLTTPNLDVNNPL